MVPAAIAVAATVAVLALDAPAVQLLAIVAGAVLGRLLLRGDRAGPPRPPIDLGIGRRGAIAAVALALALLVALPLARRATEAHGSR